MSDSNISNMDVSDSNIANMDMSDSNMNTSSEIEKTTKRKHKTLSIQDKVQLLKLLDEGTTVKRLCKIFSVGSSTIYDIKKKKDGILKFYSEKQSHKGALLRKTLKEGKCSQLERALAEWFHLRKSEGQTVTGGMLVEQAKKLHEEMKLDFACKYSHGWLDKFKNRHGIKLYMSEEEKLAAESDDTFAKECTSFGTTGEGLMNLEQSYAAEAFVKKFSEAVTSEELHFEQVYSANQTVIFWRDLPKEILDSDGSELDRRHDSEEKISVFSCFNASGTHRCKLLVVGKNPKPRAFHGVKVMPVIYQANEQSCVTRQILIEWLENHFAKEAKSHCTTLGLDENCKILLVLDSILSPSNEEFLIIDNIHILFFPFHLTVPIQPQDQGVWRWLKCWYRLEFMICYLEAVIKLKSAEEFKDEFSMKDCIWTLARAWDNLSDTVLRHSWQKVWPDLAYDEASEKDVVEAYAFYKQQIVNHVVEHVKHFNKGLAKYICYENIEEWIEEEDKPSDFQEDQEPNESATKNSTDYREKTECDSEEKTESVEDCIHLTSRLISGLDKQSFVTEQEIMYLHRLKGNLIVEKLNLRKAELRMESRNVESKKRIESKT